MWFRKNKKEEVKAEKKDDSMSKLIDEVLNEQAAAKEAAMKASAEATVGQETKPAAEALNTSGKSIAELIDAFRADRSEKTYGAVMNAVFPSALLVPMTPVEGSKNEKEKTMKFSPAFVKNQEEERLLPMFSDKEQIPEEYGKQFSVVKMPFGAACELVAKIPGCDQIIINPFTKPFEINKELVENVAKTIAQQRGNNRDIVEFSNPEPETKPVVEKIVGKMKDMPGITQAYFSKMKQQERISYAFIIDCPEEDYKNLFEQLIEYFKEEKITLPIALIPYNKLEKVVKESKHIEKVY